MYSNLNIYNETYKLGLPITQYNKETPSNNNFHVNRPLPSFKLSPNEQKLKDLHILLFIDLSGNCPHSNHLLQLLKSQFQNIDNIFILKDINNEHNLDLLKKYNGRGTPFLYSLVTNKSVLGGNHSVEDIMNILSSEDVEIKENYSSKEDEIKNLKIKLYVMNGCGFCVKLKELFKEHNVLEHITIITDLQNHKQDLKNVSGFPHMISQTTGKSMTGYSNSLDKIINELK